MAQNQAYAFERFAPKPEAPVKKVPVRVAKPRAHVKQKARARLRTLGNVLSIMVLLALICAVLQTQSTITQLQTDIARQNKELVGEQALHAYLTYELDSSTNLKNVEKRAQELGMVKMEKSQVTYVQTADENQIEVKPSGLDGMLESIRNGFLSILDFLNP